MYYLNSTAQEYEHSLQQARISLLSSVFDQFWIQSEIASVFESKSSSSNSNSKTRSLQYDDIRTQIGIIFFIFLTTPLLLFSLPFIIHSQYQANRFLHQCSSLPCISTSHRIMENLNMNKNPCDNFYTYACGGWFNKHFLTTSETSISYFKEIYKNNLIILYKILQDSSYANSESVKKLKKYFNACMNISNNEETARKTLLNILRQVGKSLLLFKDWSTNNFNLATSVTYAHQHKINPFFRISIVVNNKNNSYHCIYFEQSGLTFDDKLLYNDENIRYLFNIFGTKLIKHLHSFLPHHKISEQIDEIFLFEKRLAHIAQTTNNPLQLSSIRTYRQLQQWFSSWFDIENYLQMIFHQDKTFFYNQTFRISTPDYFEQLKQIMQTTPKYILANYISFQVIQELLPYMPESFNLIRRPLIIRLKGIIEEKQLWEICVKRTNDAFGFATGADDETIVFVFYYS